MSTLQTSNKRFALVITVSAMFVACAIAMGYRYAKPVRTVHRPETRIFQAAVVRNVPGSALPVLAVVEGDSVVVNITSNEPGVVMAHGADAICGVGLMPEVRPGHPAVFRMPATTSGRFGLHMHARDGTEVPIAAIEVAPEQ